MQLAGGAPGRLIGREAWEAALDQARRMLDAADAPDRGTRMRVALSQGGIGARGKFSDTLDALTVLLHERSRVRREARATSAEAVGAARAVDVVEEAKELASGNVNPQLVTASLLHRIAGLMHDRQAHARRRVGRGANGRRLGQAGDRARRPRHRRHPDAAAKRSSAIVNAEIKKGDVLGVARIAGVMAAKRTADLIPLCHPLALTDVQVEPDADESLPGVVAEATVTTTGRTGVEMEALTAVSVALLTVYDMAKALDRGMEISDISLASKSGGVRGDFSRVDGTRAATLSWGRSTGSDVG